LSTVLITTVFVVPPLLLAVILHEIAHGLVAERLGDPTARSLGRISLNPIVHIDFFLTILVPTILILAGSPIIFGGAKPVPVNPIYFQNPRKGMVWVAIAGPITNFILAGIFFVLFYVIHSIKIESIVFVFPHQLLMLWCIYSVMINLVLGIFNLIPVPPLDGGRIAVGLLPLAVAKKLARLEGFGILIVLVILYSGLLTKVMRPIIEIAEKMLNVINQ
jgi:Zn-dependent protease